MVESTCPLLPISSKRTSSVKPNAFFGKTANGNGYSDWVQAQRASYRSEGIKRLTQETAQNECVTNPIDREDAQSAKWRFAVEITARAQNLESTIHAVEHLTSEGRDKLGLFIPIRFIFTNKLHKDAKLLLAFDAFVLSKMLGCEVGLGKIIHGDDRATLRVNTAAMVSEVQRLTEKIGALLCNNSPPELILNRHCPECEFQNQCRQKAVEKDELSLLSGITETERQSHRSKGIFTVTQLSYTFRPRRPPKRAKNPAMPHHFALQALAIRENTVYIHGTPRFPKSETQIYLDIEGLPDNESYYLIGALVISEGKEIFHSYWADHESQEPDMFSRFVEAVCQWDDFRILHYGRYETVALKRMKTRLPESLHSKIDAILERATNVLSVIHPHVYFPVHSSGLKEIGRFLGFEWANENATGLQAIVLRTNWKNTNAPDIKAQLLQYNQDDCRALKHVVESIGRLVSSDAPPGQTRSSAINTADLKSASSRSHRFRKIEFALPGLDVVNRSAYFDYQRQKIFVRASTSLKRLLTKTTPRRSRLKPNKVLQIEAKKCASCGSRKISQLRPVKRTSVDLKFFRSGVKKWITDYSSWNYKCTKCGTLFVPEGVPPGRATKYGQGLATWCIYNNVACGQNMLRVRQGLNDIFDLDIPQPTIFRFKSFLRETLQPIYDRILAHLLKGSVLHIDETEVKLRGCKGYVWVFASMDAVRFEYRDSRKAQFLGPLLEEFRGVLISDFFTGYDSLKCPPTEMSNTSDTRYE
jgi:predicted RecB family nuclease